MCEQLPRASSSPIVVGGNGGSGTRIVAQILSHAGIFLGTDLNHANDNLLFTYLFKHPQRYAVRVNQPSPEQDDYQELLRLHEELFLGRPRRRGDWQTLLEHGRLHARGRYSWRWVLARWWKMARARPQGPAAWGFKEPHTMFFLHALHRRYAAGRYVLVLRHGLDMAYSDNDQHFRTWGPSYGIDPGNVSPRNRFELWYRSNRQILDLAPRWFAERFFVVRLEELCLAPERCVHALLRFAGIDDEAAASGASKIPRLPTSYGRYRRHDTSWIDAEVEAKLDELGYALLREAGDPQ
jgi:hypothetical protein